MSKVDVIMPQMGESITEGTLTRWIIAVGETIDRDEDLFEISTDKVDADIPSPAAGVLAEVLVNEGETVEINTIVARIETDANEFSASSTSGDQPVVDTTPTPVEPVNLSSPSPQKAAKQAVEMVPMGQEERLRTRSTPLVRKIAMEHGIDISVIVGTGANGRVTRDDILAYIEANKTSGGEIVTVQETVTTATSRPTTPPIETPPTLVPPTATGSIRVPIHGATLDIKLGSVPIRENDRVEPMSRVRLRTMEHMLMSKRVSAHVTSVNEIDFERVVRLRRSMKAKFSENGVNLTYAPFIYRAVIEALREYPILNASVDGTRIVYHANINLGIAVALNDGAELIVPVLKDADRFNLLGLAQGVNELAEKARSKTLDFDDIQGGTFTITNVGVFGNLFGMPIINQPQVAILGTGVIEKRPVVVEDAMGNDVIAIRHRAYFGLSYDHRVVDGAMAAFFLNKVQDFLENFPEETG
tara:strand:+ start:2290 stop:3705 length:1416 start_codon:yes stop_codon:yes gene_type:complete